MMPLWPSREPQRVGPAPFSTAWIQAPPTAARRGPVLPAWVPGERVLGAALVLLLVAAVALAGVGGGEGARLAAESDAAADFAAGGGTQILSAVAPTPTEAAAEAPVPAAAAPTGVGASEPLPTPTAVPTYAPAPAFAAQGEPVEEATDGALLPANRILTYYGHPADDRMGILGEYPIEELHELLLAEAANYEAVDPSRPVIPAFELIATVAQSDPIDGTYLLDTDLETLSEYADFAEANGMLIFLDLQIGRNTVAAEIEKVRPLLERPHVHLALDPEFAVAEGETPGEYIGELGADSITYAQETLAALSAELGLPPKVLIVHQFRSDMIVDKDQIAPVPGVQLVIDADGFGYPEIKTDVYNILVRDEPIEFAGVKLFYKQDKPLMTPEEILALNPPPDLIIYQ